MERRLALITDKLESIEHDSDTEIKRLMNELDVKEKTALFEQGEKDKYAKMYLELEVKCNQQEESLSLSRVKVEELQNLIETAGEKIKQLQNEKVLAVNQLQSLKYS